ncbi:MAG: nucleotidyltransferase domain-containing protein [Oscillospiraceae bacterium]|nr:nucleotidyltransferase domain-containing protein [Oscillospiraceae bacterium]
MLTQKTITDAVGRIAPRFGLKSVSYFGSYADGRATEQSDLDVLAEFKTSAVSLLTIAGLKYALEDELKIPVDVLHAPLPSNAMIEIDKVVCVYGQA